MPPIRVDMGMAAKTLPLSTLSFSLLYRRSPPTSSTSGVPFSFVFFFFFLVFFVFEVNERIKYRKMKTWGEIFSNPFLYRQQGNSFVFQTGLRNEPNTNWQSPIQRPVMYTKKKKSPKGPISKRRRCKKSSLNPTKFLKILF